MVCERRSDKVNSEKIIIHEQGAEEIVEMKLRDIGFVASKFSVLWSSIFVTLVAKKYHDSVTQLPSLHVG